MAIAHHRGNAGDSGQFFGRASHVELELLVTRVGLTPMQVTIARASVKNVERRFLLRLDGYAPYTVLQGDSEGIVQVTAPLEALPAAPGTSASAPPAQGRAAPRWTPPRTAATATQHPDMDIKLQR